jgi:hypothetical protein
VARVSSLLWSSLTAGPVTLRLAADARQVLTQRLRVGDGAGSSGLEGVGEDVLARCLGKVGEEDFAGRALVDGNRLLELSVDAA